jgi:hypothetical protein
MTISAEELERDKALCLRTPRGFSLDTAIPAEFSVAARDQWPKYIAEVERLQAHDPDTCPCCERWARADKEALQVTTGIVVELRRKVDAKDAEIARLKYELDGFDPVKVAARMRAHRVDKHGGI